MVIAIGVAPKKKATPGGTVEGIASKGHLGKRARGGRTCKAEGGPAVKPGSVEDFWQRDETGAPGELGVVAKDATGKTDWPETERISANNYDDSLKEKVPGPDKSVRQGGRKPMFTDKSEFSGAMGGRKRGGGVSDCMKKGGRLTAHERQNMPKSEFALPGHGTGPKGAGSGSYPIPDRSHAQNALARVAQHGSPSEKAAVRAAVHRRYPGIGAE